MRANEPIEAIIKRCKAQAVPRGALNKPDDEEPEARYLVSKEVEEKPRRIFPCDVLGP